MRRSCVSSNVTQQHIYIKTGVERTEETDIMESLLSHRSIVDLARLGSAVEERTCAEGTEGADGNVTRRSSQRPASRLFFDSSALLEWLHSNPSAQRGFAPPRAPLSKRACQGCRAPLCETTSVLFAFDSPFCSRVCRDAGAINACSTSTDARQWITVCPSLVAADAGGHWVSRPERS